MDGLPGPALALLLADLDEAAATRLMKCDRDVRGTLLAHAPPCELHWQLPGSCSEGEEAALSRMVGPCCCNAVRRLVLCDASAQPDDVQRLLAAVLRGPLPPNVQALAWKVSGAVCIWGRGMHTLTGCLRSMHIHTKKHT